MVIARDSLLEAFCVGLGMDADASSGPRRAFWENLTTWQRELGALVAEDAISVELAIGLAPVPDHYAVHMKGVLKELRRHSGASTLMTEFEHFEFVLRFAGSTVKKDHPHTRWLLHLMADRVAKLIEEG